MGTTIQFFDDDTEPLYLHGDYSKEGLENFKKLVLSQYGNTQRLPIIMGGNMERYEKKPEKYLERIAKWIKTFPR